jgi:hypothetical protein
MEEHLLREIGEVEKENERLREVNRYLQNINYDLHCKEKETDVRIRCLKHDCNELAGDYYRTINRLLHEKNCQRSKIHDVLFENQESIPDGVYLKLMNIIKD